VILDEPVIVTSSRGMTDTVSQQIQPPVAAQHHSSHVGSWAKAFVGFYRPDGESLRELDPIARFLYAARSVILVISLQAALIAGLLALTDRHAAGDWALDFILLVVGLVVAHAISNLSNDYFGYRRGHDTAESPRMRYTLHPVASGALTPGQLATGIGILAAVGVAIAVYFCVERGPGAIGFVLAGALLLWLYDAAPITLKGVGLGEIASFLVWGPLMVGGGYYVLAGHVSGAVFVASIPYGLGVMSILLGKHIDQRAFDISAGQNTLPVVLGADRARRLDTAVVAGMYVVTVVAVAFASISPFTLLVFLAGPRALEALRRLAAPAPADPPAGYVGWPLWYHRTCLVHNRLFGWLYIAGLAIGAAAPNVHW
jgi:1,4-dihydroxy-2-naphthoate octaprenyltransferase